MVCLDVKGPVGMEFYVLDRLQKGPSHDFVTDVSAASCVHLGEPPRCAACGRLLGLKVWMPPFEVRLETWGRGYGDLAFPEGDDFLVSQRFRMAYEREGLTGLYGFDPVAVLGVKRHRRVEGDPPPYFRVQVVRSQTAVDQKASGFEWDGEPSCPVCCQGSSIKRWRRIVVTRETWGGEDVFYARGLPGAILVSERFKTVCEANDIRNAAFIPAAEDVYDACPWEGKRTNEEGGKGDSRAY